MSNIVLNRIQTPDGTILTSYHGHDYKTYVDSIDGNEYMVDGGLNYLKRSMSDYEDLSVYSDDDFEIVRRSFHRYNRKSDKYVTLEEMEDEWLENLIIYLEERIASDVFPLDIYLKEQRYRKSKNRDDVIDSI